MTFFKACLLALACGTLFSCTSTPSSSSKDAATNSHFLTQQQAQARSAKVSDVSYQLDFTLTGKEDFHAITVVNFTLNDNRKPLRLDLDKAQIKRLLINGHFLYPNYNERYLELNGKLLNNGSNSIEIHYSRAHSTNGEGLHRFVDPVDGKIYLYSHFEPAAAQQMFAVFDQPDLKAQYEITVKAPKDWQVISTMREDKIDDLGDMNQWHFPATPKLSPYNFSMHAGPYRVWEDNSGRYPMRLFSRQSVASQVTPEDWFTYTKQGLTFFDHYFGISYPFKKYDQLLVPDFLYGAMENAGAVTFSESGFLYKAAMSAEQKQSLASVIMHEMAHQWFGDLVTMKWWNGLWLNESFASFMGTLATAEATEFNYAWRSFYAKGKQRAYEQDSKVTTHPIEVPVATTQNAFDNIDAITYQKGASTLKQLRHLIGEETFRKGVNQYLTTYSYQNAELNDFIGSLAKAAGRDLDNWTQDWLYSAGVNTIKAEFSCRNNQISDFTLQQSAASADLPTLREQKVQVALFNQGRHELHLIAKVPVIYQGQATKVPQLIGIRCPDLVYPNYEDWGYVKVGLDEQSFKTARNDLSKIADPLLRSMLWQSLWDSVQDGELPLDQYLSTVLINAPKEQDYTIVGQIIASLTHAKAYLDSMGPQQQHYAKKATKAMAQLSFRRTMETQADKDLQRRWFDAYVALANHKDNLTHLAQLLAGDSYIKGISSAKQPLNQDLRWDIVTQLNRYDFPGSKAMLQAEMKRDSSDAGQKAAIAAEVSRPEPSIKRQWLGNIERENLPFAKLRIAMAHLYPAEQQLLSGASAEQRLSGLIDMDKKGPVFMRSYANSLIPTACNQSNIDALNAQLDKQTGFSNLTRRALLETRQEEQRCLLITSQLN